MVHEQRRQLSKEMCSVLTAVVMKKNWLNCSLRAVPKCSHYPLVANEECVSTWREERQKVRQGKECVHESSIRVSTLVNKPLRTGRRCTLPNGGSIYHPSNVLCRRDGTNLWWLDCADLCWQHVVLITKQTKKTIFATQGILSSWFGIGGTTN